MTFVVGSPQLIQASNRFDLFSTQHEKEMAEILTTEVVVGPKPTRNKKTKKKQKKSNDNSSKSSSSNTDLSLKTFPARKEHQHARRTTRQEGTEGFTTPSSDGEEDFVRVSRDLFEHSQIVVGPYIERAYEILMHPYCRPALACLILTMAGFGFIDWFSGFTIIFILITHKAVRSEQNAVKVKLRKQKRNKKCRNIRIRSNSCHGVVPGKIQGLASGKQDQVSRSHSESSGSNSSVGTSDSSSTSSTGSSSSSGISVDSNGELGKSALMKRFMKDASASRDETIDKDEIEKIENAFSQIRVSSQKKVKQEGDKYVCEIEDGLFKEVIPTPVRLFGYRPYIDLYLEGDSDPTSFLVDSGAMSCTMSRATLTKLESMYGPMPKVKADFVNLLGHGKTPISTGGCRLIKAKFSPQHSHHDYIPFFITENGNDLLGINYITSKNVHLNTPGKPEAVVYIDTKPPGNSKVELASIDLAAPDSFHIPPRQSKMVDIPVTNLNKSLREEMRSNFLLYEGLDHNDGKATLNDDDTVTLLLHNLGDEPILHPKGCYLGKITMKRHDEVETTCASDEVKMLQAYSLVKSTVMRHCFCANEGQATKVFMVDRNGQGHFRNKNVMSIFGHTTVKNITVKGKNLFLQCWPNHDQIKKSDIDKLFESTFGDRLKKHPIQFILPSDRQLSKAILLTIFEFTRYSNKIEIRYHNYVQQALCKHHSPIGLGVLSEGVREYRVNINLLNGGDLLHIPYGHWADVNIAETKVSLHKTLVKSCLVIDCMVHIPEPRLIRKEYLETLIREIAMELRRAIPNSEKLPSLAVSTTMPVSESMSSGLHSMSKFRCSGYVSGVGMDTYHYRAPFKPIQGCPCATCLGIGATPKDQDLEGLGVPIPLGRSFGEDPKNGTSVYVNNLDIDEYGDHQLELDKDETYSVVTRFEEKIEPIVHETKKEEEEINFSENFTSHFDLDKFDAQEKAEICEVLETFKHCFRLTEQDHSIIRDLRVSLPLELLKGKENEGFKRIYGADSKTSGVIVSMLRKFTEMGIAKFGQPCAFVSPLFLRLRSSEEAHKLLTIPNYEPKARLISDFSMLNRLTVKLNSYLPSTKQVLHSIKSTKFLSSFDIKMAFRSLVLDHRHLSHSVIGIKNVYCYLLVALEGHANAPVCYHTAMTNGLVFSNPIPEKRSHDLEAYAREKEHGQRREIETLSDLKEYFMRTRDRFDSPETLTSPEMPYEEAPDEIKKSPTHALRVQLSRQNSSPDIVRRNQINPNLLANEDCSSAYIDDIVNWADNGRDFIHNLTSILLDISNLGVKLSVKKTKVGAIYDGKGQLEHLGVLIKGDGSYS